MDLEKYLKTQKEIEAFKIIENNIVYYSNSDNSGAISNNDSKFWGKLFDLSYQKMENLTDALNSTEVWKNSYDGSNISEEEMSEWLNDTVSRIQKLICKNSNVLEIGCGNGLIFNAIIDCVSKYTGTDIAAKGIELIGNSEKGKLNSTRIELYQLGAINIDKIPDSKFDLIIINSVAQYFSSLDYLLSIFKKLEKYASSDCVIFLGDIRSYELQKLFYLDILGKKHPELNKIDLKNKIKFLAQRENETFYHSQLFNLFPQIFDYINYSRIELKSGKFSNELNLYRYDVTLICNTNIEEIPIISVNWESFEKNDKEIIEQLKKIKDNEVLEIENIPNSRYINLLDKYQELFDNEVSHSKNTITANIAFLKELANHENMFLQINFDDEDFFKFTAYFSKNQFYKTPCSVSKINFNKLSNKINEKKSLKDKGLEEKVQEKYPGVELIKISNYLLRE